MWSKKNIILVLLGIFILYTLPADPDLGWHLKYGEYIFTTGTLLKENIFSYTMPSYSWANSYWFSQLFFYLNYRLFGFAGLTILSSTTLSFTLVLLFYKRGYSMSVIAAFLFLSLFGITGRPLFFSTIFLFLLVYVLLYAQRFSKYLPLLFLLWANMHADFTLGLFILGVYTAFSVIQVKKWQHTLNYIALLIVSGLSTLLNPYFVNLHKTLLKEANPLQFSHIGEWVPFDTTNYFTFGLVVLVIALALASLKYGYKKYGLWHSLLVVFFALLAIRSSYFSRILFIVSVFPALEFLAISFSDIQILINQNSKKLIFVQKSIFLGIFSMAFLSFVYAVYISSSVERWSNKYNYPYGAVQYIKENNLKGRFFNDYVWGGYLIWFLPEHKTFIDGRMPSWNDNGYSVFEEYVEHYLKRDDLAYLQDKYEFEYMLVPNSSVDLHDSAYSVIYEDATSIIYQLLN